MQNDEVIEVLPDEARNGWQPVVGEVTSGLREYFYGNRVLPSFEAADRVIAEARAVLSQCVPPTVAAPARTGLVCGYVQSGKTASMTAVSALARDNGYRLIVLMAGVTTNLVAQNRERLESHLRGASPEWVWKMLENPKAVDNTPDLEALLEEWHSEHYEEEDRRTLFISVMKNHSHLRNLTALLGSVDLSGVPALLFDDEADQASLNTRPGDPVASATYRNIAALRATIGWHTYLQYTATPQAPLLITRIDSLSADFAELVSPGQGYTGGETFFRDAAGRIELIPQAEVFRDGRLPLDPPPSLVRALQVFFIGVAAGRLVPTRSHRSMLVHPSKATATHQRYRDWTNALKAEWHRLLLASGEPDRAELIAELRDAHADLSRTCDELPAFDELLERLHVAINQTAVTLVNSRDGREVPWQDAFSHILVGGEKLGRGYTVKGLTVTYMPRPPGGWTADTIQQRARFFGYHSDYLGYCRVYLHPDVRAAYVAYVDHERDMRGRLAEHRGRPLREWRRLFYLDQRLAPTRRNVLSSPYLRPRLPNGWFEPHAPQASPGDGMQNALLVRRLETLDFAPDENYPRHRYAVGYLREVFEQVLVPLSYLDEDDSLGLCVVNCTVKSMLDRDEDVRCLVYKMDGGNIRLRRLTNGLIPQLFQGRSSAGAQAYPGDRAFCNQELLTVQIHMLRVEDQATGEVFEPVPAVAVRVTRQEDVLIHDE